MGGSKAAVFGGMMCGAVAAVWLATHHEDTFPDDGVGSAPGVASHSPRHAGGWHLLPWLSGAPDHPVDATLAETASDIGRYEGKSIPVEVHVVDDEGRPVNDVDLTVRVDRYEFADVIAAQRPTPTPNGSSEADEERSNAGEGYEGSSSVKEWVPAEVLPVRNGVVLAQVVPEVTTSFAVSDRGTRRAWSNAMRLAAEEDGSVLNQSDSHAYAKGEAIVVTLELDEPGTIVGTVVDEHGRPLSGADVSVSLRFGDDESGMRDEGGAENADAAPVILSDASGGFRAPVPRTGIYDVSVHAPHFQTTTEAAVQVLSGRESRVNVTLMQGFEIRGTVVDAHGAPPVEGVSVMALKADGSVSRVAYVTPDLGGTFSLEELAPGRYTVRVQGGPALQTDLPGIEAGSTGVLVRMREGGHVTGRVFVARDLLPKEPELDPSAEGSAAAYLSVSLRSLEAEGAPIQTAASAAVGYDGNGVIEFPAVPPGRYQIVGQLDQIYALGPTIYVGDGGTATFDLRLPDANCGPVDGTVRDPRGAPVAGALVYLSAESMGTVQAATDEQGRFRFASVPPGAYQATANVQLSSEGEGKATKVRYAIANAQVTVGRSATVDLVVRETDTAMGVVTDDVAVPQVPVGDQEAVAVGEGPVEVDPTPARFSPDVQIQEDDEVGAVVMRAPVGPRNARLFPGDRVQSIDGAAFDPNDPYSFLEHLEGARGSMCTIRVDRPATHETVTVTLPRVIDGDEHIARGEGASRDRMYVE